MAGRCADRLARFGENERRLRLHLPTYPFERKRYWFDQVQFKPPHQPEPKAVTAEKGGTTSAANGSTGARCATILSQWRKWPPSFCILSSDNQ
ncbi:MAG: hypothetical protein R2911_32025 [Caldilineaceae bacterium]